MNNFFLVIGVLVIVAILGIYSYNLQEQTAWKICANISPKQVTTSDNKTVLVKEYGDCLMSVSVIDAWKAKIGI